MLPHSGGWVTHSGEVTKGGGPSLTGGRRRQICNILTNQPEFRKLSKDFISIRIWRIHGLEKNWENLGRTWCWGACLALFLRVGQRRRVYLGLSEPAFLSSSWLNVLLTRPKTTFVWHSFELRRCAPEKILLGFSWLRVASRWIALH